MASVKRIILCGKCKEDHIMWPGCACPASSFEHKDEHMRLDVAHIDPISDKEPQTCIKCVCVCVCVGVGVGVGVCVCV